MGQPALEDFDDQSGERLIDYTCNAADGLAGAPDPEDVARKIVAAIRTRRTGIPGVTSDN